MPSKRRSSRERTRRYRERMRAKGLRRIELCVPDTRAPGFAEQAPREALALANSPYEKEDQAFVDAISIDLDDLDE